MLFQGLDEGTNTVCSFKVWMMGPTLCLVSREDKGTNTVSSFKVWMRGPTLSLVSKFG